MNILYILILFLCCFHVDAGLRSALKKMKPRRLITYSGYDEDYTINNVNYKILQDNNAECPPGYTSLTGITDDDLAICDAIAAAVQTNKSVGAMLYNGVNVANTGLRKYGLDYITAPAGCFTYTQSTADTFTIWFNPHPAPTLYCSDGDLRSCICKESTPESPPSGVCSDTSYTDQISCESSGSCINYETATTEQECNEGGGFCPVGNCLLYTSPSPRD